MSPPSTLLVLVSDGSGGFVLDLVVGSARLRAVLQYDEAEQFEHLVRVQRAPSADGEPARRAASIELRHARTFPPELGD